MADVRIPSSLPAVTTPTPARTNEAVRAAQRAFFNTALSDAGAPVAPRQSAPTAAASPVTAPQPSVRAAVATPLVGETQAAPTRALRPGSLLDIRI